MTQKSTEKTQVTFEVLVSNATGTIVRADDWSWNHLAFLGVHFQLRTIVVDGGLEAAFKAAIDNGGNPNRTMKYKSL